MRTIRLSALIVVFILAQSSLVPAAEIAPQFKALHVLNRLGFGPRPGDIARVNAMGVENYIHEQLYPDSIPESAKVTAMIDGLSTYSLGISELYDEYGPPAKVNGVKPDPEQVKAQRKKAQIILLEASQARLIRAIESPRQLQELMVDFWFNHFNIYSQKELDRLWIGNYEKEAIRPFVLGHFRDLLEATAKHPAMLYYLDNWQNVDPDSFGGKWGGKQRGLNENYARELMELHTLGVDGGYSQDDVTVLARILTGWGFQGKKGEGRFDFYFNGKRHDHSDKVFLSRHIMGNGEGEVEEALDILAKSTETARHISFQLAQYFVADNPDPVLVDQLADTFESTDGDIRAVLQTLFASSQFWDEKNYANKFKTPFQYIVSVVRASGEEITNYRPLIGILQQLGMPLYGCLTPDGYKNTQDAWLNPDGMLRRINFDTALSLGNIKLNDNNIVLSAKDLMDVFDSQFSDSTKAAITKAPERLQAALVLGSPELMKK